MYAEVFAYSAWFSVLHRVYLVYTLYGTLECGARHIESTLLSSGADAQEKKSNPPAALHHQGVTSYQYRKGVLVMEIYGWLVALQPFTNYTLSISRLIARRLSFFKLGSGAGAASSSAAGSSTFSALIPFKLGSGALVAATSSSLGKY